MVQWLEPTTPKQLRGFLGLTGCYCRFIKNYESIAHALADLLKKDAFLWTHESQKAFDDSKHAITCSSVLQVLDFLKLF